MPQNAAFMTALIMLASLVVSTVSYPIAVPNTDTGSELARRAPPAPSTASGSAGSYAIISPSANFLVYDNKFDSYLVYFKFGDTSTDDRDRAYSTHNPSVIFKDRKDTEKGQGKEMEKATLVKLVKKLEEYGIVRNVGTTSEGKNSRKSEWYEIYLGQTKEKAYVAKAKLRELLKLYGDETDPKGPHGGKSREAYIKDFLKLFPPIDDSKAQDGTAKGGVTAKSGTKAAKAERPVIDKDARGSEQPNWWKIAKVDKFEREKQ